MQAFETPFPVSYQQATTQGFLESDEDVLDYELSSLKNKPADRSVTVPDTPVSRSSVAPTTEEESTLKEVVQLVKPTHASGISDLSVAHIDEAPTSSPNTFLVEVTTPLSTSAPTASSETNSKNVHLSAGHSVEAPGITKLTSKISPSEKPSATISAIQKYSKVQSLAQITPDADPSTIVATESAVVPKMEERTKGSTTESSEDFQRAFAFSTLASSEEPDTSGEEDVELQLESLVITQSPTIGPSKTQSSTKMPSTAIFTNVPLPLDDDLLTRTAIAQSNTVNESSYLEPVTDKLPAIESVSKATEGQSTQGHLENTSALGTEQPDVRPKQQPPLNSSNETTTVIALEHATVPLVQKSTSQTSDNEYSSITLPSTYSYPLENMKPNATAGIAAEPIWEANTVSQELPVVYNTSVQSSSPQVDSVALLQSTSTIATLATPDISLEAIPTKASEDLETQNPPHQASTPEQEKTTRTSTEAFNPTYNDEMLYTEVSKDSTQPTTYTSPDQMLISQSSNDNTAFPSTYAFDVTTQGFNAESTTEIAQSQSVENGTVTVLPTESSAVLSTEFADNGNDTTLDVSTSPSNFTEPNVTGGATLESIPKAEISELASTTATSLEIQEVTPQGGDSLHGSESPQLVPKQSTSTEHVLQKETETTHRELETTQAPSGITQASIPSDLPASVSDSPAILIAELTSALPSPANEQLSSLPPVSVKDEQETLPAVGTPDNSSASPAVPISVAPERAATVPPELTSWDDDSSTPAAPPTRATTTEPTAPPASATPPAFPTTSPAPRKEVGAAPGCVPLEPPRSPTHEFRLVFNTSAEFSWEQVEALEQRIQRFARDDVCPRRFARTAFELGPPHVLSWTDPSANSSWCDRAAVDALLRTMRADSGHPTPEVTRAFYPEFKIVGVELRYRGACADRRGTVVVPVAATVVGVVLSAALLAGLATLLWRALRLVPSRSRKLDVTAPAAQPSFDLKQRRPILLPGESRAAAATNGTPSKSPHTKPNPPFVVDTDFCYINPNFLEVVKPSPPPPPPYRRSLDRRVRSLEAVLPAPPPRPPHGPHSTLGSRSLRNATAAEQDEGTSSSSGVESDAQPSGEAKSNESS
ncbi:hypothetical protein V5799_004517 [Amblyomma americanum]|uniref:Peptidase S72 domain-containing protein n=1 Tax=Amblyomma americanum TaxID=6943 RepID=A0AAQ4D5W3_AMBAM